MAELIDKDVLVAEIEKLIADETESIKSFEHSKNVSEVQRSNARIGVLTHLRSLLNTLEVKDHYEQCVQYDSIKAGIQAHAETYSFNIESELFHQLTKEQQKLWRKEIEQAVINGGEAGVELARDTRYKDNVEAKDVDLETEVDRWYNNEASKEFEDVLYDDIEKCAKHFTEWQEKQMMSKAIGGYVIEDIEEGNGDFLLSADYLPKSMGLKDRQKVKVIVIKED